METNFQVSVVHLIATPKLLEAQRVHSLQLFIWRMLKTPVIRETQAVVRAERRKALWTCLSRGRCCCGPPFAALGVRL